MNNERQQKVQALQAIANGLNIATKHGAFDLQTAGDLLASLQFIAQDYKDELPKAEVEKEKPTNKASKK